MVAWRARIDVAVAAEWKEVPLQTLAVGLERIPHHVLNRDHRCHVIGAVQDNGRTTNLFCRLGWVNRSQRRRGLVAYGRIVADESAHLRRGGDKVNGNTPAHAIAADRNSVFVHLRLCKQMTPTLGENTRKLRIPGLRLNLRSGFDVGRGRIAKLFEDIDCESIVAQLREFTRFDFDIVCEPALGMDEQESRSRLFSFRIGQKPGYPIIRSEEHTSELQSPYDLVCRLLLEK